MKREEHESEVLKALRPLGVKDKALEMQRYHKTERETLGVSNPEIDAAVRNWRAEKTVPECIAEANALWTSGVFEARIAAAKLITKARYGQEEVTVWQLIQSWVPDLDGWAIADHVAKAGERRIMANLSRLDSLEVWTRSDHLWTKRAALVFTLPLAKLNNLKPEQAAARARVLEWAAEYVSDKEWFIQKAVAWWLRTLSKHAPDDVRGFMDAHGAGMKAFARKDATRQLASAS